METKNGASFIARLQRYSLLGWIRHIRLKLSGRKVVVAGNCMLCGRCCRRIGLEAGGRWLRSEAEFRRLVGMYPDYSRFSVTGKDDQGFLLFTCSWYSAESGVCRDHENRLTICRSYPDIDLYFTGGEIHDGCGYRFTEIIPFENFLQAELETQHVRDKKQKDTGG